MLFSLLLSIITFFTAYASDAREALDFIKEHRDSANIALKHLTPQEKLMAMAIVAPEVSQYSHVMDFVELRSMFVIYVHQGAGDFSVGRFQMKPSFLETLERKISSNAELSSRYSPWIADVLAQADIKEKRRMRLRRLDDVGWQLKYLAMFFEIAKRQTSQITFKDDDERVRYFATLYNSGLTSDPARVRRMMQRKLFPRHTGRFNYSDVAAEFYEELKNHSPL